MEEQNQGNEQGNEQGQSLSPEQAQSHINAILTDKTHPYHDLSGRYKSGHLEAVAYVESLYKAANPEGDRQSVLEPDRGLHDIVKKEFGTTENVEDEADAAREKMEDEKNEGIYKKADTELRGMWGQLYNENMTIVDFVIDRIPDGPAKDRFQNNFKNDVEMADLLSKIGRKLDEKHWGGKAKIYKREKEIE